MTIRMKHHLNFLIIISAAQLVLVVITKLIGF